MNIKENVICDRLMYRMNYNNILFLLLTSINGIMNINDKIYFTNINFK